MQIPACYLHTAAEGIGNVIFWEFLCLTKHGQNSEYHGTFTPSRTHRSQPHALLPTSTRSRKEGIIVDKTGSKGMSLVQTRIVSQDGRGSDSLQNLQMLGFGPQITFRRPLRKDALASYRCICQSSNSHQLLSLFSDIATSVDIWMECQHHQTRFANSSGRGSKWILELGRCGGHAFAPNIPNWSNTQYYWNDLYLQPYHPEKVRRASTGQEWGCNVQCGK